MTPRCLALLATIALAGTNLAGADEIFSSSGPIGVQTAPVVYAPTYYPAYTYSWDGNTGWPVGYNGYHWIYGYMSTRTYNPYGQRNDLNRTQNLEERGKTVRGRKELYPAEPHAEFEKPGKTPVAAAEPAQPTPTAEKALLKIVMPVEEARLYFDNQEAKGDGKIRYYQTPALKAGQDYKFTLKAAWATGVFDDQTLEEVVTFRAGETKTVEFRKKN